MTSQMRIMDVSTAQKTILRRTTWDEFEVPESVFERNEVLFGARLAPDDAVRRILADVRNEGDTAVRAWTEKLDGVRLEKLRCSPDDLAEAYEQVSGDVVEAMRLAAKRIEDFHRLQPSISWIQSGQEGTLGQLVRPIARIGIYVPGGTAPLPSSLLMTAIPARVAGVKKLCAITPPQRSTALPHPTILIAADIAKVDDVYVAGGAQAIGALAFGTESVPRVDKICGPGSLFTTLAKRQVYGMVGIDGLPGPTETMVVADGHASVELVAADLLAQAEHDVLAKAILLTPNRDLAVAVQREIMAQLEELSRAEIAAGSLASGSGIVVTDTVAECIALANEFAPEHLCLLVQDAWSFLGQIDNAGGVFLGEQSFEVLGDYVAGPSHVMPTGGTARFASPINVLDFVKLVSVIGLNGTVLSQIGSAAETLAMVEGLDGHGKAVRRRME